MKEEKDLQKKEPERVTVICSSFIHRGVVRRALFDNIKKEHYFEITKETSPELEKVIRRFTKIK